MELCEEERKTHLGGVESQTGGGGRETVLLREGVASERGWCPEL